jgi:tetratricopeptide (TPR) repeat protein
MTGISQAPPEDGRAGTRWLDRTVMASLMAATAAVYAGLIHAEFLNYDDPLYVTSNDAIRAGLGWDTIRWAATTGHFGTWHPLTWMSHALDVTLFGLDAGRHHLTSVALHAASAATLYWVLRDMTGARLPSAFVAALFALHPLNVGSVAWISERKNVLSTLFLWLTIGSYARWARTGRRSWYLLALLCFAVGLTAKPMLVTLPFLLLVLEVWPLERVWTRTAAGERGRLSSRALARRAVDTLPFLALAMVVSVVTFVLARADGAVASLQLLPLSTRLATAIAAYAAYLGKAIWPSGLAVYYPYELQVPTWEVALGLVVVAAASAVGVWQTRRRPYVLVGWLWYVGTLVPVIGLVQVGSQSMADRYAYVPLVGIFVAVAWLLYEAVDGSRWRSRAAGAGALAVLSACMARSAIETTYWRSSEALFTRAIAVTRDNTHAHDLLAMALEDRGDAQGAIRHFEEVLRLQPSFPDIQNDLGNVLAAQGRVDEAIALYRDGLRRTPNVAQLHFNLALALEYRGDADEARREFREALRLMPEFPDAHYRLAGTLARDGDVPAALTHYREAIRVRPRYPEARTDLGNLLSRIGRQPESLDEYRAAIRDDPTFGPAYFNLARSLQDLGDLDGAFVQYERAVALLPQRPEAHFYFAAALEWRGALQEATREYRETVRLRPTFEDAHRALGRTLAALGDPEAAATHLAAAEHLRAHAAGP